VPVLALRSLTPRERYRMAQQLTCSRRVIVALYGRAMLGDLEPAFAYPRDRWSQFALSGQKAPSVWTEPLKGRRFLAHDFRARLVGRRCTHLTGAQHESGTICHHTSQIAWEQLGVLDCTCIRGVKRTNFVQF